MKGFLRAKRRPTRDQHHPNYIDAVVLGGEEAHRRRSALATLRRLEVGSKAYSSTTIRSWNCPLPNWPVEGSRALCSPARL